jgi:uncharacterized membrane protein
MRAASITAAGMTTATSNVERRVVALDLLRLLAGVQMVQGHTIDAVLAPEFRRGMMHALWQSSRGLTSVAFLFAAGLAFHLVALGGARATREAAQDQGRVLARRLRRAGTLVALGYALHLPVRLLFDAQGSAPEALAVDVLQCMGVGLASLSLLVAAVRDPRAVEVASAIIGAVLLAFSARCAQLVPSGSLLPLLHYVSPAGGSLFPLLPWAAHLCWGVALGGVLRQPTRRAARLLALAMGLFCAAAIALTVEAGLVADHLSRLGLVLLVFAMLEKLSPLFGRAPAWLFSLSRLTLFVYVFHIVLVYGDGVGLSSWVGASLSPWPAIGLALGMLASSFGFALGYARWSSRVGPRASPAALARSTATG